MFGVVILYFSEWWFSCGVSGEFVIWFKLNMFVVLYVEFMYIYFVYMLFEGNEDLGIF